MNTEDINNLFARINRIKTRLEIKDGLGTRWDYKFENGEVHKYILNGVKSPEEIGDDIANAFVWLWSLKDHIKKSSKQGDFVESQVNGNPYLCICADLANGEKHGGLDRTSRSGKKPKLGRLKYQIPQAAIGQLAFGAFDVNIDVNNAHLVVLEMSILDEGDNLIGDAFEYLDKCINAWESIMQTMQKDQHV
ncbi:MAG: hypothetical protein AABZ07_03245 [Nitrospirota bacterium]